MASDSTTNATATAAAPLPNVPSIAEKFSPIRSTTVRTRLMFEIVSNPGRNFADHFSDRLFMITPATSGNSIVNRRGCNSGHGFADKPGIMSGSTNGMKTTLATMSKSMRPTENARSPFANSASFGRNGARPPAE